MPETDMSQTTIIKMTETKSKKGHPSMHSDDVHVLMLRTSLIVRRKDIVNSLCTQSLDTSRTKRSNRNLVENIIICKTGRV